MSYNYTSLSINGSEVVYSTSAPIRPNRLTYSHAAPAIFEFSEGPGRSCVPGIALNLPVVVKVDKAGTNKCVFRGRITRVGSSFANGFTHLYTCVGLEQDVDLIPIAPEYVFNAEKTTPEYNASLSGRTVGQIVKRILDDRTTELQALGFDLTNLATDIEAKLTFTPVNTNVRISGERLFTTLKAFTEQWQPRYSLFIEYTSSGAKFSLADRVDPQNSVTLAIGDDHVDTPSLSISIDGCATRVIVRGAERIEPRELSLVANTLVRDWTTSEQTAWKLTDFTKTSEAQSVGSITATSGDTVTVDPSDNSRTWTANHWAGEREGQVYLQSTTIPGIDNWAYREIVSNTALTAGGTSVLTLGEPVGAGYTTYKIFGKLLVREHVWRRYKAVDAAFEGKLRTKFNKPVTYAFANGSAAIGGIEWPMAFLLHPDGNFRYTEPCFVDQGKSRVWFSKPIVTHAALGNTTAQLNAGTVNTQPYDVVFVVPVSMGFLEAIYPPNSGANPVYSGLAKDWYSIDRTKILLVPDWSDPSKAAKMLQLAEETHKLISSPVVSGSVTLLGFRAHECVPPGRRLTLSAKYGAGGAAIDMGRYDEALLSIESVSIIWGGAAGMQTSLSVTSANNGSENLDTYMHYLDGSGVGNLLEIPGLPEQGFSPFGMTGAFDQ